MDTASKEEKKTAYTAIVERIRAMIMEGELVPGEKMPPERKLAERFGVSRSHLRQAFQALAERKIIESRQGDGTYLLTGLDTAPTVDTILEAINAQRDTLHEIIEFRRMIEPQIAALAAQRIDAPTLDRLKVVVCDQQRFLLAGRKEEGLDAEFHRMLAECTGNRVLGKVMATIHDIFNESRAEWLQSSERRHASVEGHLRIIDALESGDPERASQAMQHHIGTIEQHILGDLHE